MRTVRTRFMPLLAAGLLLMATAAGCRTQPRDEDLTASAPDAGDSASSSESSADYQPQQVTDPFGQETLTEEALGEDALAGEQDPTWIDGQMETLYFEFDRSSLSETSRASLDHNADFLLAHPDVRVRVGGHCDERGTVEYNLALGDRRASSAREYLVLRGVAMDRLQVVSFGEEQPADPGQGEAAWARNRRVEFNGR
ncbi:MAG: peptidoglycan-associated lipoprotein Pal [Acidobacteria bacterium]|nr:peptidoglycan-associated lipoprotein Pal [Acidobacteriota bacterium]